MAARSTQDWKVSSKNPAGSYDTIIINETCNVGYVVHDQHTYSCYPITVRLTMVMNSEYSQISEPALELHSRAAPSVGGNITTQSVLTQEEIPEEGQIKNF